MTSFTDAGFETRANAGKVATAARLQYGTTIIANQKQQKTYTEGEKEVSFKHTKGYGQSAVASLVVQDTAPGEWQRRKKQTENDHRRALGWTFKGRRAV